MWYLVVGAAGLFRITLVAPQHAQLHVPRRGPGHAEVVAVFEDRSRTGAPPKSRAVFGWCALDLDLVPFARVRQQVAEAEAAPVRDVERVIERGIDALRHNLADVDVGRGDVAAGH